MRQYFNLLLALELLMIESGIQQNEDHPCVVNDRVQDRMHKLEDRFVASELDTVDQWLYDYAHMPSTFGAVVRGETHIGCTHARCIPQVMEYMREISK